MTKQFKDLVEGDHIVFRPGYARQHEKPQEMTVTKVTRLSVHVRDYRFDRETGRQTNAGGYAPGHAWVSMEEFERERDLEVAWRKFCNALGNAWRPPQGLTLDRLEQLKGELL